MPQLLLLHGALGNADSFAHIRSELGNDYHIFAPDLPGHRKEAALPADLKLPSLVQWLRGWMQQHGLEKPLLFGYSLGGYLGLMTEIQYPGSFAGILTYGTRFSWTPDFAEKQARQLNPENLREKAPQVLQGWEHAFGPEWLKVHRLTLDMMKDLGQNPYLDAPGLENIAIPVSLTVGEKDFMTDEAQNQAISSRIPGSKYEFIPAQPHLIEKTDAAVMASLIKTHLPA